MYDCLKLLYLYHKRKTFWNISTPVLGPFYSSSTFNHLRWYETPVLFVWKLFSSPVIRQNDGLSSASIVPSRLCHTFTLRADGTFHLLMISLCPGMRAVCTHSAVKNRILSRREGVTRTAERGSECSIAYSVVFVCFYVRVPYFGTALVAVTLCPFSPAAFVSPDFVEIWCMKHIATLFFFFFFLLYDLYFPVFQNRPYSSS